MDADFPTVVFESNDPGVLAVAKSLLDDAEIEYFVRGEAAGSLYPGAISVFMPAIVVRAEDAAAASELLALLDRPSDERR